MDDWITLAVQATFLIPIAWLFYIGSSLSKRINRVDEVTIERQSKQSDTFDKKIAEVSREIEKAKDHVYSRVREVETRLNKEHLDKSEIKELLHDIMEPLRNNMDELQKTLHLLTVDLPRNYVTHDKLKEMKDELKEDIKNMGDYIVLEIGGQGKRRR